MLNLHRLAHGAESYYLDQVISGIEDYYAGDGEAPGYWLATSDQLGLDGTVQPEHLRAVLTGHDPHTGEQLHHAKNRKVPGWDLTFRAPKSVSILWGLSEQPVADQVVAAHEAAIAVSVDYLEDVAAFTRTGRNGIHRVEASGFIAAGFRHRTSRDGDPLLHTHVLVANSVCAADGKWRTIDAVALYDHAKTAGYIYAAHLRHELTARLGVGWTDIENGLADIDGVTPEVIALFSKRREQIEAQLAEWGLTSAKAAQISTLETRQAKDPVPERTEDLTRRWRAEAAEAGWTMTDQHAVVGRSEVPVIDTAETTRVLDLLSSAEGLTERASTFDERDVICRLANELPAGIATSTIHQLADAYLARPDVVALGWTERCGTRFSTTELIALEERVLGTCGDGLGAGATLAPEQAVRIAIDARPSMTDEQRDAIRQITTSGNTVDVIIAGPGTGKTFSLDAAREAWQRSGHAVIGCALSAAAANQLQSGSGIRSTTIAMLDIDLRRRHEWFDSKTVLVVDEAGMVGTRAIAPLLDQAAAAGAKVVLVGDTKQLPEIDAGGLLRALEQRHPIVTLNQNRRQQTPWEREALDHYRSERVDRAIDLLDEHGGVVTGRNSDIVREAMVRDWWHHREDGDNALMMAGRNSDVDDLNRRARGYLATNHQLHGETLIVNDRPFQIGDTVVCLHNDHRRKIRNGMIGEIVTVDHDARSVLIDTTEGLRRLPEEYLDEGWMRHGYAVTVHKAQGLTCEHGLLLASDEMHHEMGYVGLSRGTNSNLIYAVSDDPYDPDLERHAGVSRDEDRDPLKLVIDSLSKSAAKDLAVTELEEADLGIDL